MNFNGKVEIEKGTITSNKDLVFHIRMSPETKRVLAEFQRNKGRCSYTIIFVANGGFNEKNQKR